MWTMHFTGMLALRLPVAVTYTVDRMVLAVGGALALADGKLGCRKTAGVNALLVSDNRLSSIHD